MIRSFWLVMAFVVSIASSESVAQEKTLVAPMGVDIYVRIQPTVTVEGNHPVAAPRIVSAPDPVMPKDGINGTVVIKCVVDKEGRVREPIVIQTLSPQNDESALKSALKWRFVPVEFGGRKVEIKTTLVMTFRQR